MSDLKAWVDKFQSMTVEDLREFLHEEGIVGRMSVPTRCPLANFFSAQIGGGEFVVNGQCILHVDKTEPATITQLECVDISDGDISTVNGTIGAFVYDFDKGRFPELLDNKLTDH